MKIGQSLLCPRSSTQGTKPIPTIYNRHLQWAGLIKLGPWPGSGRPYRLVDSQRAGPSRILIFFKASGQLTGFMLGGPDGLDWPRVKGPTGLEWGGPDGPAGPPSLSSSPLSPSPPPPPPPPPPLSSTYNYLLIFHTLSKFTSFSQFALIFFNTSFSSIVLHITWFYWW